jgi:hypothetical protein
MILFTKLILARILEDLDFQQKKKVLKLSR